ncbi:hypothetical protein BaRGS_00037290 [Batillaria attramentaria]|uniref:Uncharacterized protein n=1 Tax=Batillaria attramentaria TaxID=370345 RepID=A0ABD0J9E7_9CAEN
MSAYSLDKPLVLAEFSQAMGGDLTSPDQFTWAYTRGYSGSWSWQAVGEGAGSDSLATQLKGMGVLKDKDNQTEGGRVAINIRGGGGGENGRAWCFGFAWLIDRMFAWLWG